MDAEHGARTAGLPPAGSLLVATTELLDPNFADSVVLLLDVNDDGALGVVLNRPSEVEVGEVLAGWGSAVGAPEVLFRGGPVSTDGVIGVGLLRDPEVVPVGWQQLDHALGVVDLETPTELVGDTLVGLRVYVGYAGWGADQLRGEIAEGSWYVVGSRPEDWFRADTTHLWRDVLRRQPGMLAWHATRPVDAELN